MYSSLECTNILGTPGVSSSANTPLGQHELQKVQLSCSPVSAKQAEDGAYRYKVTQH